MPSIRVNKRRRPSNALPFTVIENVKFLKRHANDFGLPQPAPLHGCDSTPPVYLPAAQNYEEVCKVCVASCMDAGTRAVGYSSFTLFSTFVCLN